MKLTTSPVKRLCGNPDRAHVTGLFRLLGVKVNGFDLHSKMEFEWMLKDAEAHYRERMRIMHPDAGGNHGEAVKLNKAIQRLRKMAAKRNILQPLTVDRRPNLCRIKTVRRVSPNKLTSRVARLLQDGPKTLDEICCQLAVTRGSVYNAINNLSREVVRLPYRWGLKNTQNQ